MTDWPMDDRDQSGVRTKVGRGEGIVLSALVLALLLLIHLAPAALGANRPLPWFYNAALAGLVLAGVCLRLIFARDEASSRKVTMRPVAVPLILFGLVIAWAIVQILPTAGLIPAHPLWSFAMEAAGVSWGERVSVDPVAGALSVVRFATYFCVFVAVYLVCRSRDRAHLFLRVFAISALIYAVYGFARLMMPADKVLWFDTVSAGIPSGPFMNRNNAATYFGLGALASLGVIWLRQQREKGARAVGRRLFVVLFEQVSGRNGIWITIFLVLSCSVLLTGSRAGSGAFAIALTSFFLFARHSARDIRPTGTSLMRRSTGWVGAGAAAVVVGGVLFGLAGGPVGQRIGELGLQLEGRASIYPPTLAAFRDNIITGTGLGTFEDVFAHYRAGADVTRHVWDKAHNDYLELFLGLGLPMGLVFLAAVALLFRQIHRGLSVRHRDQAFCVVALAASIQVAVHAVADFSLQIQAVGLAFVMVLAIGSAQSISSHVTTSD